MSANLSESLRRQWVIEPTIPDHVSQQLKDYPPVTRQLLYNRGVTDSRQAEEYLFSTGSRYDPFLLRDMEAAVDRLDWAVKHGEVVAVYGDYDVDGVTATVLMVELLRALGAQAYAYIPNRFEEGYGLNMEALDRLAAEGAHLVLTVDCGIRSPREAEHARRLGLELLITDHHEPHAVLPEARALICQKQPGDPYPEKNLAGVGLAYKIAEALLARRQSKEASVENWLDLVAVGTVADVVPLVGENRSLVKAGLRLLQAGQRQGFLSLAGAADLMIQKATARDIGFVIGPRLNAAGRLESAQAALEVLMATEVFKAGILAQKLDNQNRQRQELTRELFEEAQLGISGGEEALLISVHADPENRKMGVVGLVASRLVDTYYRPAIVAAQGSEYTHASCRSIPEFHITRALDECADLMERHGGHAMAAGFKIRNENLPELVCRLKEIARRDLAERDLRPVLRADMEIPLYSLRTDILAEINALEPCGLGNPGALFVSRGLQVLRRYRVGKDSTHLRMVVSDGRITFDAIAFRLGYWDEQMPTRVDLLYAYEQNVYQGKTSLQLNVKDIKPTDRED